MSVAIVAICLLLGSLFLIWAAVTVINNKGMQYIVYGFSALLIAGGLRLCPVDMSNSAIAECSGIFSFFLIIVTVCGLLLIAYGSGILVGNSHQRKIARQRSSRHKRLPMQRNFFNQDK
jgi:hypothetical protein